ncbi:MAG: formylglycine-generating enzyme family protein [Vicinamibacterales bacterium]
MRQGVGRAMTPALAPIRAALLAAVLLGAGPVLWSAFADQSSGPSFVEVPAGPFTMGAGPAKTPEAFDNERWSAAAEEGTLDLPAFYIARHETTIGEYAAFVAATGWTTDPRALAGPVDAPVAFVSWPDALAYCRWLTRGLAGRPPGDPVLAGRLRAGWIATLPTEAQWEKAARGPDGRRYPWGVEPRRDRAQFDAPGVSPVGAHPCPECAYGLDDMAGNVWEWTRSPSQPYPYDEADDRQHLDTDALWTIRGGGFADRARLVRGSARGAAEPGARRAFIGFRVAIVPPR